MSSASIGTDEGDATASQAPRKSLRILSCIRCQQRKIRCDRQTPCNNCIRSRVECVSAASLGPRPRRRRLPERELLTRLRHYEDLLRQNNIQWDPQAPGIGTSTVEARLLKQEPSSEKHSPQSPTDSQPETVSRSKNIWHALNDRINDSDDESSYDEEDIIKQSDMESAWNAFKCNESLLFGTGDAFVNRATLHPDQTQIFRLWQIFIDNVEPVVQLLHAPTMQKRIIEASANVAGLEPDFEALLFSIYCMALKTMTSADCQATFGTAQDYLLIRYQFGCQQALFDANFHRTTSRECLTALYFYLMTLKQAVHVVSLSAMLGTAVRIARRLGYHAESSNNKCEPFEAEMRRRLWWALVHYDGRICEMADHQATSLDPTWDCKAPLNLNNFDLRPDMDDAPIAQEQLAESILPVIRAQILDLVRHSDWHLDFVNPTLKSIARHSSFPGDGSIDSLETVIEEKYLKLCNPQIPLHLLTLWTTRSHIARLRLASRFGRTVPDREHDHVTIRATQQMLDYDTKLKSSPLLKGFTWYTDLNFPFIAWMYIGQSLKRYPLGELADESWRVMQANHDAREMYKERFDNPFFSLFTRLVNVAWEARVSASREMGAGLVMPPMVISAKEKLAQSRALQKASFPRNPGFPGMDLESLAISPEQQSHDSQDQGELDWLALLGQPQLQQDNFGTSFDMDVMAGELLWN